MRNFIQKLNQIYIISPVKTQDKLFFVENLRLMLKSGVSLSKALKSLSQETMNSQFKNILFDLHRDIEKGKTLADSLSKHENIFGQYFINMVGAGESSGKFENVLEQLYIQIKKEYELKTKLRNGMIYPAIIVVLMLVIVIGMLLFIIPELLPVFSELGIQLPLPTRIIIAITEFFIDYKFFILILAIIALFALIAFAKTKKGRQILDSFLLKFPISRGIVKKICLARFARTFGSLIQTDLPITKCLEITSGVLGNYVYKNSLLQIKDELKKGRRIKKSLEKYPELYTPLSLEMISVGEETGSLDQSLDKLAAFYENQVDQSMKNLPTIIEPAILILLGIGVGFLGFAIIMPIYYLAENL